MLPAPSEARAIEWVGIVSMNKYVGRYSHDAPLLTNFRVMGRLIGESELYFL